MIEFGMRDGMVRVVFNPGLAAHIPPSVMARVNDAERQFAGGASIPSLIPPMAAAGS
jgi:hypothetical protein